MRRLSDFVLARLSRVTSSGLFLPEIDGARFVAIIAVVLFHSQGYVASRIPAAGQTWLATIFGVGHVGPQLFFAISGFILSLPFAAQFLKSGKTVSLRAYFLRRVTRLEPPYFIHLLALLFMMTVASMLGAGKCFVFSLSGTEWFKHFLATATYQHNVIYGGLNTLNCVLWSLEIEIQFYLLAPLLALSFRIRPSGLRRACLLAGIVLFSLVEFLANGHGMPRIGLSIVGKLHYFLVGFLLADLYMTEWRDAPRYSMRYDVISLVGWIGVFVAAGHIDVGMLFIAPLTLLAYVGAFRGVAVRAFLGNAWVATIGGMCYTIYMYHYIMISVIGRVTTTAKTGIAWLDMLVHCAILAVLILLPCSVLFVLFERPFMQRDWPQRFARRMGWGAGVVKPSAEKRPVCELAAGAEQAPTSRS